MEVSARSRAVPWSGVRKMFDLAGRYEGVINLSVGEPDFDTPRHVLDTAVDAMKAGYTRYTPNAGLLELREALAEKLRKENGIEADPATEIIVRAARAQWFSLFHLSIVYRLDHKKIFQLAPKHA